MQKEKLSGISISLHPTNSVEFFMHRALGEAVLNLMQPVNITKIFHQRDKSHDLGLYVHVPFCTEICMFCAFHREVPKPGRQISYVNALENHIEDILIQLDGRQSVDSVYFGGGTPGLLRPDEVERLFIVIGKNVDARKAAVTFELHPENVSVGYIKDLTSIGVKRFSVGVQNLSADERTSLGRDLTSSEEDLEKLKMMKNMGVTFNVDLMFGTPQQTMQSWMTTLEKLVDQAEPEEITLYQYVNAFGSQTRKKIEQGILTRPGIIKRYRMYNDAKDILLRSGYDQTSTLSFSKTAEKGKKRKLLNRGRDFVGLGPRTYSKIENYFFVNDASTSDFVDGSDPGRFYGFALPKWFIKISEKVLSSVGGISSNKNNSDLWKCEAISQVYGILYYILNQPRIYRR